MNVCVYIHYPFEKDVFACVCMFAYINTTCVDAKMSEFPALK